MCDVDAVSLDVSLHQAAATWRGIRARQLFRLALESTFFWATCEIGDRTRTLPQLSSDFLESTPGEPTVSSWLLPFADPDTVDAVGPLLRLDQSLRVRIDTKELALPRASGINSAVIFPTIGCART
jgi:hypothetical protein